MSPTSDYVESYAQLISERYKINIAAEKVNDEYILSGGLYGSPRKEFKTFSATDAITFLDGLVTGYIICEREIYSRTQELLAQQQEEGQDELRLIDMDQLPDSVREKIAQLTQCPDCLSTTTEPISKDGIWYMEIQHSETCPAVGSMIRRFREGEDDE